MEKFLEIAKKMFGNKVEEYQERASKMSKAEMDSVLAKFQAIEPTERKKLLDDIKKEIGL